MMKSEVLHVLDSLRGRTSSAHEKIREHEFASLKGNEWLNEILVGRLHAGSNFKGDQRPEFWYVQNVVTNSARSVGPGATANAVIFTATVSTVSSIDTYTQFGGGGVVFRLASNSLQTSCPYGFWIRGTDAGAKSALAQILAAYHAGSSVAVSADTSTIWSGAGSAACLVGMFGANDTSPDRPADRARTPRVLTFITDRDR
jgi:hypothetical protein